MIVRELDRVRMMDVLSANRLGRLGCSDQGRPYVVPITYSFVGDEIYSFSMPGRKIDIMRANPSVCLQVDAFGEGRAWQSVLVSGLFEELPDRIGTKVQRDRAWSILEQHANWWEPGGLKPLESPPPLGSRPVYYRIAISEMTGREAIEDE